MKTKNYKREVTLVVFNNFMPDAFDSEIYHVKEFVYYIYFFFNCITFLMSLWNLNFTVYGNENQTNFTWRNVVQVH